MRGLQFRSSLPLVAAPSCRRIGSPHMLNPPVSLQIHSEYRSFSRLNCVETRARGRRGFDQSLDDQLSTVVRINSQRGNVLVMEKH